MTLRYQSPITVMSHVRYVCCVQRFQLTSDDEVEYNNRVVNLHNYNFYNHTNNYIFLIIYNF